MTETAPGPSAPYPVELERDITLRDGTALRLRPIRADDAPRLVEYYGRLSAHTAYQRFFTVMKRLPPDWARLHSAVDYRTQLALAGRARAARAAGADRRGPLRADR